MTYADCLALIRDRLLAPDVETLSDEAIGRTFLSVYRQWWKRFSNRTVALPAGSTVILAAAARQGFLTDKDIVEVISAHVIDCLGNTTGINVASTVLPGEYRSGYTLPLYTTPMDRISVDEMRELYARYDAGVAPAAGLGIVAGPPALFSLDWWQKDTDSTGSGAWSFMVFPPPDAACFFPMVVRRFPEDPTASGFTGTLETDDDETVGLCAVTAIRLLPNVGKQNDAGLVQALASEVPQEMQGMMFAPKVEDSRLPFTAERPV
jgi:hypothetical protein